MQRKVRWGASWPRQAVYVALLIGVAAGLKWLASDPLPSRIEGAARLVDGDSLHLGAHEVRLKGIDAPEGRQVCRRNDQDWECGKEARRELARIIANNTISCDVDGRDQHGRLLAFCRIGQRDINAAMVASGYAVSYGAFRQEESAAKAAKRGLWSGEFDLPREWRRKNP